MSDLRLLVPIAFSKNHIATLYKLVLESEKARGVRSSLFIFNYSLKGADEEDAPIMREDSSDRILRYITSRCR